MPDPTAVPTNKRSRKSKPRRIQFDDPHCARTFDAHPVQWSEISLPKHAGETLPQIVFEDPSYILFLHRENVFLKGLELKPLAAYGGVCHELEVVANRMRNIRPPSGCEFAIVLNSQNVFSRFIVVTKGDNPKRHLEHGEEVVERIRRLDIGIPQNYPNPALGFERLARCLRRYFLGNPSAKLTADACAEALTDDTKFDLRRVPYNKYLKPVGLDLAVLRQKYLDSVASWSEELTTSSDRGRRRGAPAHNPFPRGIFARLPSTP